MDPSQGHKREVTLSRDLGLFTVTMIGVGGMIGAGIFVLTGIAAGVAGPALVVAFLLNGLVTSLTAMAYAELGSAYPEAGGGYLWVKEAFGGAAGFMSGWSNWFAHTLAGTLYALTFGRFAAEVIGMIGLPTLGMSTLELSRVLMTGIIVVFAFINYLGASETGTVGNIVTMTKVFILAMLVFFCLLAMAHDNTWVTRFTQGFMPNGVWSIAVAMGLTFIAFEGYEIIAQSGEEVINPKRNIPRAIFVSIGLAVVIYVLVGFSAIGAVKPPQGLAAYQYLGQQEEVAIVEVARQTFPFGIGAIVLLISGLASTMSALNATTYSASRASFAMGRDHNLPAFFARVHPTRRTPFWAVICSGVLMAIMGWSLPIMDVAAAADIMFLLLFIQVNLAVLVLRHKRPDLDRGFKVPWFPVVPVLAVLCNLLLALHLFSFSPIAWYAALIWLLIGLFAYLGYFARKEAMEKPKEILLEEVLVSRDYSVLVPVSNLAQAHILGQVGAALAHANGGEILALHVVQVPPQLDLGQGRLFLKEGRPYLQEVIEQAKPFDVPVHTVIRLGRNVPEAIRKTAVENASDMLVLGWPGYTRTSGRLFGSVADPLVDDPPTDVAVVRYRKKRPLRSVLVPVAGGPNSRRATKVAVAMATTGADGPARVTLLHVLPPDAGEGAHVRTRHALEFILEGIEHPLIEMRIVEGADVVETVLAQSEGYDLIVLGATEEPLFKNLLVGKLPEKIARRASVTVVMVKRSSGRLHSFVRQTLLEPTVPQPLE
jgi:amino acid transporter/nucleotide-binding universal stress UspA family protein